MFASQLAVFQCCPEVISRLLRKNGSVLTAAKVLVISRLLHNKLSEQAKPPAIVERTRERLASLRRRLLLTIDRRLTSTSIPVDDLVDVMSAFSLATSSSQTDVLRHFHHTRSEAILVQANRLEAGREKILQMMQLWIQTLRESSAVFSRRLKGALAAMKTTPIFQSLEIQSIADFDCEIHARWIGEEIRSFTPYIRHDDLQPHAAEKLLMDWAQKSFSTIMGGIVKVLSSIEDPMTIHHLRTDILQLWFSSLGHVTSVDKSAVLGEIRHVLNQRLTQLIRDCCASQSKVTSTIEVQFNQGQCRQTDCSPSLWDTTTITGDISNGARNFKSSIISRTYGHYGLISIVLSEHNKWLEKIESTRAMIRHMTETRWEQDLDDENDDDFDDRQEVLAKDDPDTLRDAMAQALEEAYSDFQSSLEKLTRASRFDGAQAIALLRITREVKQQASMDVNLFETLIPSLQLEAAKWVLENTLGKCRRLFKHVLNGATVERPLWEGSPELPILPSPWIFKLLRQLASNMSDVGSDIWSPKAVDQIKEHLRTSVITQIIESQSDAKITNGHKSDGDGEEGEGEGESSATQHGDVVNGDIEKDVEKKDQIISPPPDNDEKIDYKTQLLFNLLYLHNATKKTVDAKAEKKHDDKLDMYVERLLREDLHLTEEMERRITSSAAEYWKRTSLLFALLC